MQRVTLEATPRETGKGVSRRMRVAGRVPAVLYGRHQEPKSLSLDAHTLGKTLKAAAGRSVLFDLNVAGDQSYLALVKDSQRHPLSQDYLHIDLQAVDLKEKLVVEVPLHFEGLAAGVKEGGILETSRRTITVRCLPTAIPDFIAVDISSLAIGQNLHANDLTLPVGVEFPHAENYSVVQVVAPQKEEVVAAVAAVSAEVPATAQKSAEATPAGGAAPAAAAGKTAAAPAKAAGAK